MATYPKRIFMMVVGVVIIAVGIAGLVYTGAGTDPCTCMMLGLSKALGIRLGIIQPIMNCLILACVFFFSRDLIGAGTLVNMLMIGGIVDLCTPVLNAIFPASPSMPLRVVLTVVSIIVISLGVSLYMTPMMGLAPYDILAFIIMRPTKIPFRWCRVATDVLATAIGFFLGSAVGVGTVITALFMGPLVSLFNHSISEKLLGILPENAQA